MAKPVTIAEAQSFLVADLKAALQERGASVDGKKSVLLARLVKLIKAEPTVTKDSDVMQNVVTDIAISEFNPSATATPSTVPQYWGSILEGAEDPAAKFEEAYGDNIRNVSMAMISEPYLTPLCRKGGAFYMKEEAYGAMRTTLEQLVGRITAPLATADDTSNEGVITFQDVKDSCQKLGIFLLGNEDCFYSAEMAENETEERATIDHVAAIEKWRGNKGKTAQIAKNWKVFCNLMEMPSVNTLTAYTILSMSKLVGLKRASARTDLAAVVQEEEESGDKNSSLSIVSMICGKFDSSWVPLKQILSYVVDGAVSTSCGNELFDSDVNDNWDGDICHDSVQSALDAGVENVAEAQDNYSDATLLHYLAVNNKAEECQKLIKDYGADVNAETNDRQQGDGWGELHFEEFRPLNFACANGAYETAKVLLMNGADATHKCGSEGGSLIPCTEPRSKDYWYTRGNTALHQAARGNHVNIIKLLLNGPDPESIQYAQANDIDLSCWRNVNIEQRGPTEEVYLTERARDEGDVTEEASLTPLAIALMFRNFEAANALLARGACIAKLGNKTGAFRQAIMRNIAEEFPEIVQRLKFTGLCESEQQEFLDFVSSSDDDDDEEDDDDDEEPWEKDDWDEFKAPSGDLRVRAASATTVADKGGEKVDEEEEQEEDKDQNEEDEEEAVFLPSEECAFAPAIAAMLEQVHPNLQVSRNAQHVTSDICEMFIHKIVKQIMTCTTSTTAAASATACGASAGQPVQLTKDSVLSALPSIIVDEEVRKYGRQEIEKEKGGDDMVFVPLIESFLAKKHYQEEGRIIHCERHGIVAIAQLLEYLICEILELSGNATRDLHLKLVTPHPMMNLHDVGVDPLFDYCVAGNAIRTISQSQDFALSFCGQKVDPRSSGHPDALGDDCALHPSWETAAIKSSAVVPESLLIKGECKYFLDNVNCPFGPLITVRAFASSLLQTAQGGRRLARTFSPKAALALQLTCEMLMITTVTKAVAIAIKRLNKEEEEEEKEEKEEEEEEKGGGEDDDEEEEDGDNYGEKLTLCATDIEEARDAVLMALLC